MGNLLIYSAAEIFCIWSRALPRHYRGSRGAAVLEVATLIAAAHHAVIGVPHPESGLFRWRFARPSDRTHRPPHRHHAHPCPGGPSDWAPSLAQRSIRRKCRSDCILSPASQGRIAGYRIGRDRSAYVRAQLAHSKGLSVSSGTGRRAVGRCRRWVNHGARARPASSGMSALSPIASEIRHRSEVTQGANRVLKHRSMAGY
jgi:hypothetical protein